ncbi:vanadium-dependent haloperoxidase [Pedobacter sp.]|uniref:vanadium-dependent haloperoxidase n=1 Tax=Pedobacter sp. TaxID=1411316 RepID=UPI003D7FFD3B
MKTHLIRLMSTVIVLLSMAACKKDTSAPIPIDFPSANGAGMVLKWNEAGTAALTSMGGMPPMQESRIYAMINLAMHDALNSTNPKYERYAYNVGIFNQADPDAAVAQAAHDVIVHLFPDHQTVNTLLSESLSGIADNQSKTAGIEVGKLAAKAMIEKRTNDGESTAQFQFTQGTIAGAYRSTPPFDAAPYNGMVMMPGWGKVHPFGLLETSQFRASEPYAINSAEYTADYNEIKTLGCKIGSSRTEEQAEIAVFWLDNVPMSMNRVARKLIVEKNLDAWKAARLLSILHMAEADANISAFDSKFFYNFWRPITAVRLGEQDGNPNTIGDPEWDVMAAPTPPVPDYPSNHSISAAAAAEVFRDFFGTDEISFSATSDALPNVTRRFSSFSSAAKEIGLSRIYVGYHFRHAVEVGLAQGQKIGDFVNRYCLKEINQRNL